MLLPFTDSGIVSSFVRQWARIFKRSYPLRQLDEPEVRLIRVVRGVGLDVSGKREARILIGDEPDRAVGAQRRAPDLALVLRASAGVTDEVGESLDRSLVH